jgi:hypothetical protein
MPSRNANASGHKSAPTIDSRLGSANPKAARANVAAAGLQQFVGIREGIVTNSLINIDAPIASKLRSGAFAVADNIFTFKTTLRPYVLRMQNRCSGFDSVTLPIGSGMEYARRL